MGAVTGSRQHSRPGPERSGARHWVVWGGVLVVGVLVGLMAYHALTPVTIETHVEMQTRVDSIDHEQQTHIHGIGYDEEGDRLFIATHHGLFRLENATAEALQLYLLGSVRWDFMGFSLDATNGQRMFASGHPGPGENLGVMRSDDGGFTWERVWDGPDGRRVDFHSMALSPADPDRLVGSWGGGLHVTTDAGGTWTLMAAGASGGYCWGAPCIAWDLESPDSLWMADGQRLLGSDDLGESWQDVENGTFAAVYSHPADGRLWAWKEGEGIVVRDGQENWTRVGGSLDPSSQVFQFTGGPDDPDILFAAALPGREVYRTTDGGESWQPLDLV